MPRTKSREIDIDRLCGAMKRARLVLRRAREERREMIRQYLGQHWSEEGTAEKVPVNLLALYVSIVGRNLIAKNPRVLLSTFDRGLKPTVSAMQTWANQEIVRMKLSESLRRVVTDALFSIGICKVALATPAEASVFSWRLGAGQPFAERVDLDDFVYDIHARAFEEAGYIGHRFRVPLDVVKDSKIYSKARLQLTASNDEPYNQEGDERTKTLGTGYYSNYEEFEDFVDLWEVYVPRHRQVITLADEYIAGPGQVGSEPLRVQNWIGPDNGPYHILGLGLVPGNAMPKGPCQDLVDMHEANNRTWRKLVRAIDRMKEVTGVRAGAVEDGNRVMTANDGDIIRLDDPKNVAQLILGAQHSQTLFAMGTGFKDLFSWLAGNLDIMGGLSPQSKTATQDQMLNQNSNRAIADMQESTISFAAEVIRSLLWYWWHDPFKVQSSVHKLPGLPEFQLQRHVTPDMRKRGRFEDLDISVDPYSLQHQTPQTRMAALNQVMQQIVIPLMPILVQQGITVDINAFLQKVAQFMDMPDLGDVVTIQEPPTQGSSGGQGKTGGMPQSTNRTYTRENMPGRTRQGDDMNRINSLMGIKTGGNPQANGQPVGAA